MPKLTIDGKEITVENGMTVLQACEQAGVEVPRFCYHERLSIAGNCRMCLVQIEGGPPKPAASCAMPAGEGMVVHTDTPMVKKAREGVMEFLLINHPLDCPICDQGGECDLQDQAVAYGRGTNRFEENKRSVVDKYMGPLIKTFMNRCIQCTRCIRFSTEIAGVPELGATGRGEHMEVGTYVGKAISSELSGNLIDICPVGALTSKPTSYKFRSWELKKTESIDVLDAVGCNIRVDSRGLEVMRILPRLNESINEEWISDKTRFSFDGLKLQRLDRPMVKKDGRLTTVSWEEAFATITNRLRGLSGEKIAAIAGDMVDSEAMLALKDLMSSLGSPHLDCRQDGAALDNSIRASYLFNTTIEGIEKADVCLLIGTNPRHEASLINARLRKRYLKGGFTVASIGKAADLTYPVLQLGDHLAALEEIVAGSHSFSEALKNASNPMIIIGQDALKRNDGEAVLALCHTLAENYNIVKEGWNGFNVLHKAASRVAGLDLGLVPAENGRDVAGILEGSESGDIEVVYLLGADEIDTDKLKNSFVIYQGHHGDKGAHCADVILPGAAYTEKNATYVNTEGRVQRGRCAVTPPGEAKEDWRIIATLAEFLGNPLPYTSLSGIRQKMAEIAPHFARIGAVTNAPWQDFGKKGNIALEPLEGNGENYYMTNPISRASRIMAECTSVAAANKGEAA